MLEEAVVAGVTELALLELLRQRLQKTVPFPTPAAGAELSIAVPAGVVWELIAVRFRFVASAVVANRFNVFVVADPDANEAYRFGSGGAVTASSTIAAVGFAGLGSQLNGGTTLFSLPTPPALLPSGWTMKTGTSSIDVGDQYSQALLVVREWSIREALLNIEWLKNHAR